MNFKHIISLAAMSTLLMACSSSDEPANDNAGNGEATGTSYLNIAINLPSVSAAGGRADDQSNDQFYDGDVSEYAVKTAHLVIFKGATEADAKVQHVYPINDLKPWNLEGTTTEIVTTTAQTISKINETPDDDLWVLVVLNDPSASTHFSTDKKLSELNTVGYSDMISSTNGFFMTNAPLYKESGATTLVKLKRNNIYTTQAEAQAATPIDIYVERGVAKVSVTTPAVSQEITMDSDKYIATIKTWNLGITGKTSYLVRNVSEFGEWKDLTSTHDGAKSEPRFYSSSSNRIYWAIDPNYDKNISKDETSSYFNLAEDVTLTADKAAYCLENTFDVAHQHQNQTTRVIFKAEFKKSGASQAETFYTIGSSSKIYDKAGMQTLVIAESMKLFTDKNDKNKYTFATNTSVTASAGEHSIEPGDVLYDGASLTDNELDRLNKAIGTINTYKDGTCYYTVYVQHFGDTYTPWTSEDPTYGEDNNPLKANNNFLGRYGVLRNNWYELAVSEIKTLGHPVIPVPDDTPDDEKTYFINFKVKIHSWAKRVQNVKL